MSKFIRRLQISWLVLLIAAFCHALMFAQATQQPSLATYIKENYTKREVSIPMRDGVKLFTSIYEPKARAEKIQLF